MGVRGYPTLKFFPNGMTSDDKPVDYTKGYRNLANLVHFVNENSTKKEEEEEEEEAEEDDDDSGDESDDDDKKEDL